MLLFFLGRWSTSELKFLSFSSETFCRHTEATQRTMMYRHILEQVLDMDSDVCITWLSLRAENTTLICN